MRWDVIIEKYGIFIDSCASGGGRNDLGIKSITFVETVDLWIHRYVHQHYTGHAEG